MSHSVRLIDVAKEAGVSVFTVSEALRDTARVKASTKARIQKIAHEMGYQRDAAAALLYSRRKRGRILEKPQIGCLSTETWGELLPDRARGYDFVDLPIPEPGQWPTALRQWWHQGIDGLIISTMDQGGIALQEAVAAGVPFQEFPVVTVGPSVFHCVRDSPSQAMSLLIEQTLARGYRRIAVVLGSSPYSRDDDSRLGAALVARERLPADAQMELFHFQGLPLLVSEEDFQKIREFAPDAVAAFPGGVYWSFVKAGFRIPEDFAFCGSPITVNTSNRNQAGASSYQEEFFEAALDIMEQLLKLREVGLPLHPRIRVIPQPWQEGSTMPDLRTSTPTKPDADPPRTG